MPWRDEKPKDEALAPIDRVPFSLFVILILTAMAVPLVLLLVFK